MHERSTRLFVKGKPVAEPLSSFNTTEQKRIGWEMRVRMKIIATVLHEAHELQVGAAADALEGGRKVSTAAVPIAEPEGCYNRGGAALCWK